MKDEYGIVLDYLEHGHGGVGEPAAQIIGTEHFSLLEVIIREGQAVDPGDKVYIGDDTRKKVKYIKGRIPRGELTANARAELDHVLEDLIAEEEEKFVKFFNEARPLTTRQHSLELLPGVGKKHMWELIEAREEKPFESFEDLKERVKLIPDPKKLIMKRIQAELDGDQKYYLFVAQSGKKDRYSGRR